jgi:uncharacterized Ntn-hydrolase superfamily protein
MLPVATFSLVAKDPNNHDLGVVVASKFLAVGSVVPWLEAGVGAVATQSYANTSFGVRSLEMLKAGLSLEQIAFDLGQSDPEHQSRQYGVVSANGSSYSFTGSECHGWAGGRSGQNYAAQGNLLTGANVIDALVETFLTRTELPFPERLLTALQAADTCGGDARGRQSAALYVARERGGYAGMNDRYIDLRSDDHATPIPELQRLLSIHRLLFERPNPEALLPIEGEIAQRILLVLQNTGHNFSLWSAAAQKALLGLAGTENLEERFTQIGFIDQTALMYFEQKYNKTSG